MKSPFRSIRQKLFNEGMLVRYLGYAVGEIALIIIGIFFALQLNNWNEDKKTQAEFEVYIEKLKGDVSTAIDNVKSSKDVLDRWRVKVEYIPTFLALSEHDPDELVAFEDSLNSMALLNRPQVYVGLLGEIFDGKTESIRHNPDLAQKALVLEGFVESKLDNIQNNAERVELIVGNRLSQLIGFGATGKGLPPKYDLEDLKSSKEFSYITYSIKTIMIRIMGFNDQIVEELESFLAVLEEYE